MRALPWPRLSAMLSRGECEPLLLVTGDSDFLIERAARALSGLVPEADRALCLWSGTAAEADPDRLLDDASTLPMGGPRRVLLIREAEKFPALEHSGWKGYLRRPSRHTVVAFIASAGADAKGAIKALQDACAVVPMNAPSEKALPAWIRGEAKELGAELAPEDAVWMVEIAGRDPAVLRGWLERAALYRGATGRLSREDLEPVGQFHAAANVFGFSDRIGEGNAAAALQAGQRLIDDGEEPLMFLGLVAGQLRRLAMLKHGLDQGKVPARAAEEAGVRGYAAQKVAQARARTPADVGRALGACAAADRALKSVRVSRARVLDSFVLEAARRTGRLVGPSPAKRDA